MPVFSLAIWHGLNTRSDERGGPGRRSRSVCRAAPLAQCRAPCFSPDFTLCRWPTPVRGRAGPALPGRAQRSALAGNKPPAMADALARGSRTVGRFHAAVGPWAAARRPPDALCHPLLHCSGCWAAYAPLLAAWQAKYHRLAALTLLGGAGLATCITFLWFSARTSPSRRSWWNW